MIVNKFIIVLCIIFLILLIRKLTYENFQTSSSSSSSESAQSESSNTTSAAPQLFSSNINYNCDNITNENVCNFLENAGVCKVQGSGQSFTCIPSCKFDINNRDFISRINEIDTSNDKMDYCMTSCLAETDGVENSNCNQNECLERCNNLNFSNTDGLVRYQDRASDQTSDSHYEDIVNRITNLPPNDPLIQKILLPLRRYSTNQDSSRIEQELAEKIQSLNTASNVLSSLNDQNIEVNKEVPQKMMTHIENLLRKKRKLNENIDFNVKAAMVQEKINRIKEMTNYFSNQQSNNNNNSGKMHEAFRSVKCLSNGLSLNIQPVIRSVNSDSQRQNLFISRENEYIIKINNSILFYEKRNTGPEIRLDDGYTLASGMVCRSNSETNETAGNQCKFVPTDGYYVTPDNTRLRNNVNLDGSIENDESTWNNFVNDGKYSTEAEEMGVYFKIIKISNNIEYNNKLKTSGSLNYEMNSINYPFYIIQPVNHIDKCLNLKKTSTGARIITIEKTSNKPTERFNAFVYTSYDPVCSSE